MQISADNLQAVSVQSPRIFQAHGYDLTYQIMGNFNASKTLLVIDTPLLPHSVTSQRFCALLQSDYRIIVCTLGLDVPLLPYDQGFVSGKLIQALVDEIDVANFSLLSGSFNTLHAINCALHFSKHLPNDIESIMLYAPIVEIPFRYHSGYLSLLNGLNADQDMVTFLEEFNALLGSRVSFKLEPKVVCQYLKDYFEWPSLVKNPSVAIPVRLFRGVQDHFVTSDYLEEAKSVFKNSTIHTISGSGHLCMQDNPMACFSVLQEKPVTA